MRILRPGWTTLLATGLIFIVLQGCSRQKPSVVIVDADAAADSSQTVDQDQSLDNAAEDAEGSSEISFFPNDSGGKLLAELLPPSDSLPKASAERIASRVRFPTPNTLNVMEARLPPNQAAMPFSSLGIAATRNRLQLPEETLLAITGVEPVLPEHRELPAGERVHVPSPRLDGPLPLSPLATEVREFPSTDDPTSEYSIMAAMAAPPPRRTNPAPFLRTFLPDPFENRPAAQLSIELPEATTPVTASPQPPRR